MAKHKPMPDLEAAIAAVVERAGLELDEVAFILEGADHRRVLIALDGPDGVTLDQCAAVSREVSDVLDASRQIGDRSFTLEVSSRGMSKPLTMARHWRRNEGRLIRVVTVDGEVVEGRIGTIDDAVADTAVTGFEVLVVTAKRDIPLPVDEVKTAVIQPDFSRAAEVDLGDEDIDADDDSAED